MNQPFQAPAVVLGLSPTGLYAVRELGRAGIKVTGVCSEWQTGCCSRYLTACIVEPDEYKRLERLMGLFADEPCKAFLVPTSDKDVEFIAHHVERLGGRFVFQSSYTREAVHILLTKERFYALCQEQEVAYPRLWRCEPRDLPALRDQLTYPCMIKPSRIHDIKGVLAGKKGWVAESAKAFDRIVKDIPAAAGVLLVQEIVPGPESEITLFAAYRDEQGRIHQSVTGRKLRQYPPGFGSASLVVTETEDESRRIGERLLALLSYAGIAAAEFKRDPRDGLLKVIEMNARPSLWFSLAHAAGQKLVLAAYRDLTGSGLPLREEAQQDRVVWRFVFKDLYSAIFYHSHPSFVLPPPDTRPSRRAARRVYAVFAFDDPLPMFAEWVQLCRKAAQRLIGMAVRRLGVSS